jgi:hypothetical protein
MPTLAHAVRLAGGGLSDNAQVHSHPLGNACSRAIAYFWDRAFKQWMSVWKARKRPVVTVSTII